MYKNIIITAADSKYFELLKNLVYSYHKNAYRNDTGIRVIDLGLTEEQKTEIKDKVIDFVKVDWHLDFKCLSDAPEYKKAFTVTPFLPEYCQDAETIIWIDADAWLQTPESINGLIEAAQSGKLAICPETHHLYPDTVSRARIRIWNFPPLKGRIRLIRTWLRKTITDKYTRAEANRFMLKPVYNAGIFAGRRDADFWQHLATAYQKANIKKLSDLSDQSVFNYAIHSNTVEVYPLPAQYNWICDFGRPVWHDEKQKFVEPMYPYQDLHIIHLLGLSKDGDLKAYNTDGVLAPYDMTGENAK